MNISTICFAALLALSSSAMAQFDPHGQIEGCAPGIWYDGAQALGAPLWENDEAIGYWKGAGFGVGEYGVSSGLNLLIVSADGRYVGHNVAKLNDGETAREEPYYGTLYCIGLGQYIGWNDVGYDLGRAFVVDLSLSGEIAVAKDIELGAPSARHEGNILMRMRPGATLHGLGVIGAL